MALTCCLWHAFDIWQIAHSAAQTQTTRPKPRHTKTQPSISNEMTKLCAKWWKVEAGKREKRPKSRKIKIAFCQVKIGARTRASTFNCHIYIYIHIFNNCIKWVRMGREFKGRYKFTDTLLGLCLQHLLISTKRRVALEAFGFTAERGVATLFSTNILIDKPPTTTTTATRGTTLSSWWAAHKRHIWAAYLAINSDKR